MKIYVVGGAVRDELMGLVPKDFDYVVVGTNPREMLDRGFKQVGADFPVFLHPVTGDEYALARTERKTGAGYLGFEVVTDDVTLSEDLYRRDLTINAMARPVNQQFPSLAIIDPHGGLRDFNEKILRHVSPAFEEDPLRVIRLCRFFARYKDFNIASETMILSMRMVERGDLNQLATERFWGELTKVFQEERPDRFFHMMDLMGALIDVTFFRNLYGEIVDVSKLSSMSRCALAVRHCKPDERVMIHTALMASPLSTTVPLHADTRTKNLFTNIQFLREMKRTEMDVFNLLKRAKAWGSSLDEVSDLCRAMTIANLIGESFVVTPSELLDVMDASLQVSAEQFMHIYGPGVLLGKAIERGRKEAIAKKLDLH